MTSHRIADADAVPPGTLRAFTAGTTEVVVANVGGRLCALQRKCPHMGEDLGRGTLRGTALVCPRHAAAFDVTSGKAVDPAKLMFLKFRPKDARTFPVRVVDGALLVEA